MTKRDLLVLFFIIVLSAPILAEEEWPSLGENIIFNKKWPEMTEEHLMELLEKYSINARNEDGMTALMFASYTNNNKIVKILIDEGADVSARDDNGWTPLMYAARGSNNHKVFKTLLEAGADVSARDNYGGWTPLMRAALFTENPKVIQVLLDYGADPAASSKERKKKPFDFIKTNEDLQGTEVYKELKQKRFDFD